MAEAFPGAIELFYSYAQADQRQLDRLETYLAPLRQEGLISSWHQQKLVPGQERAPAIAAHLNTAQIILLLISPDFLASDACYSKEMTRALERHRAGEARVIPILLRPVVWERTPFADLMPLPDDAVPISGRKKTDDAYLNVVRGIRRAIDFMQTQSSAQPHNAHRQPQTASVPGMLARAVEETAKPVGFERPATAFVGFFYEDQALARNLQMQLQVRGVRVIPEISATFSTGMHPAEMLQAIEQEADALVLLLTPASLRDQVFVERVIRAVSRRMSTTNARPFVLLSGLTQGEFRQFCETHELSDLANLGNIPIPADEEVQQMRLLADVAHVVLKDALGQRFKRIQADQSYEPTLSLHNWDYQPPVYSLDLDLNWSVLVPEKQRLATSHEWEQVLLPALKSVKQVLSASRHSRRLHIFVQALLPATLALGFLFPESSHMTLLVEGRHGTWSSEAASLPEEPLICQTEQLEQGERRIAAIELSITRAIEAAGVETLKHQGITPGLRVTFGLPGGPSQQSVTSAEQAISVARQVGRHCRLLCDQQGVQHIHLFAALPAALGVLLGHQLSALCPITLYDHTQESGYQPFGVLR